MSDNIFFRLHSLKPLDEHDARPLLMEDNPSRDYFFPLTGQETIDALKTLPKRDFEGVTHVWLRRIRSADLFDGLQPLCLFTWGSNVRLITLWAWPRDMILRFGKKRPPNSAFNEARDYGIKVEQVRGQWQAQWNLKAIKRFYIKGLLFYTIGHHIDSYYRVNSKAITRTDSNYPTQYATAKTALATHVFQKLEKVNQSKKFPTTSVTSTMMTCANAAGFAQQKTRHVFTQQVFVLSANF